MIPVTKPFFPPLEEYYDYLEGIWQRQWLTNNGPLVNELEMKLKQYLGLTHLLYVSSGTIALQLAIKALNLSGEILTTPFSYVATSSSIAWEGCKPVYVDIDEHTLNIDPYKISAAVTSKTSAILATHVFGNPCNIDEIQLVANKYNLKVIYDAAHCFGTFYKGKSVFAYGDICTTSFHATKLFHTVEGGGVFTNDAALLKKMSLLRNFGHDGPEVFNEIGINGKNSEIHAAMGLSNLKYIAAILNARKIQSAQYQQALDHSAIQFVTRNCDAVTNNSFFPVVFKNEETLHRIWNALVNNRINPRRYFYPSLNKIYMYKGGTMPVSESISSRILCLPLYHTLSKEEITYICRIIIRTLNNE